MLIGNPAIARDTAQRKREKPLGPHRAHKRGDLWLGIARWLPSKTSFHYAIQDVLRAFSCTARRGLTSLARSNESLLDHTRCSVCAAFSISFSLFLFPAHAWVPLCEYLHYMYKNNIRVYTPTASARLWLCVSLAKDYTVYYTSVDSRAPKCQKETASAINAVLYICIYIAWYTRTGVVCAGCASGRRQRLRRPDTRTRLMLLYLRLCLFCGSILQSERDGLSRHSRVCILACARDYIRVFFSSVLWRRRRRRRHRRKM